MSKPYTSSFEISGPPAYSEKEIGSCVCCTALILGLILGVSTLVYAAVLYQTPINFCMNSASLTEFSIGSTNNSLHYNLTMNLTVRNPNRRGLYYERIVVTALFQNQIFGITTSEPFYQGTKNTTNLPQVMFHGDTYILLNHRTVSKYAQDVSHARYDIVVYIDTRVRMKVPIFRTLVFRYWDSWALPLPVSVDGKQTYKCQ